ncbi:MAG TPA: PadR family transcriptional regulator [Candidatus Acidoferrum sp.]|nr:PadR family transcriptional regulator [Candidatus Acidoferrum sp.]
MKAKEFAHGDFMPMEAKRIILKIRILGYLKVHGEIYSYALIKEFEKQGFCRFYGPTIKNDLYNALRVLEKAGYIKMHSKVDRGKSKNYYSITRGGTSTIKSVGKMMMGYIKEANRFFE